jgi:tetratricopeptide (TPR) repeat protein
MMKKHFLFFIVLLSARSVFSQPASHDGEIMQIKGKWTKHDNITSPNDPGFPKSQYSFVYKKTDSIGTLLKRSYPNPTGLEAIYYTTVGEWPVCKDAPASYSLKSLYKSYYFNTHLNKILLADETSTVVRIYVNSFGYLFLQQRGEDWMIDGKPLKVFEMLERDEGEWNGFPLYKSESWRIDNQSKSKTNVVLITRDGKLPFKPLTQKQYLVALKYQWNEEKKKIYDSYAKSNKEYQKAIDDLKKNSALSADAQEKIISSLEKDHEKYTKEHPEDAQKLADQFEKKIKIIDGYLSSHSDQDMQQPVVTSLLGDFPGYFGADKNERASAPIIVDPSYFKSGLPKYVPQFMVIEWNSEPDAPGSAFRKQFENNFAAGKLTAMIDAQKKGENVSDEVVVKWPDLAAIRRSAERYADSILKKKQPGFNIPIASTAIVAKDTLTGYIIARRNAAMLRAVPSKSLTPPQLKTYIEPIEKKYASLLLSQGNKLPDVSSFSATSIVYASTLYLLDGSNFQAAWCALKAIEKAPDDIVTLNNAGGVLNACGFQPVAIPVLQTALDKSPGNSGLQNNIGQSYMGLGDMTKAAHYLQQALSSSPYHPHANFAMACIEYKKGNNSAALNYVQKSLRGSFTDGAMHLFYKLKPDGRLWDILKNDYKPTDYFNEEKYHLPSQCENIGDVERMEAEYKAYNEMIERVKNQFDKIKDEENDLGMKAMMEKTKNYKTSGIRTAPFSELGAMMVLEIGLRLTDEAEKLSRAQAIYKKEIGDLDEQYRNALAHAESCGEQLALGQKYMEAASVLTREYQKIFLPVFKEYFTDYAFWGRLQFPDKHLQRAAYAAAVSGYLAELNQLAVTHFAELCDPKADVKKEEQDYVFKEPDCGIDIGMNLGIGSFRIDCEKVEYHFGGLLVADVLHSYKTHSTTIAIGAGLDLKFGGEKLKAGPIRGGFGATGKMQYFLTFDGTRPSDQGFIWEGALEYEQTFNTELGTGIKKIDEVKTKSVDLSAKTVLSIQNGFNSSGSLYEQLDKVLEVKPEKQVNKNVKIYNSQK